MPAIGFSWAAAGTPDAAPSDGTVDSQQKTTDKPRKDMPRARSIHFQLLLVVAACLAPMLVAIAVWIETAYTERRAMLESDMLDTSTALSLAVDREITTIQSALKVLALSKELQEDDIAGFYKRATQVLTSFPDSNIVLADRSGQELAFTLVPFGEKLPRRNADVSPAALFDTGSPTVSNLFFGAVSKRPAISIDVPVFRDGAAVYDLAMGVPARRFSGLLQLTRLPPQWIAALSDRNLVIVARSQDEDAIVGRRATRNGVQEGSVIAPVVALTGESMIGAFTRSTMSGWTVAVLIPASAFTDQIWRWLAIEIAALLALVVLCVWIARRIATRITQSIQALIPPALALGHGAPVTIQWQEVAEANAVARSLCTASDLLAEGSRQRGIAERSMRSTADMLRATFEAVPVGIVTLSPEGRITQWNRAAEAMSGRIAQDMLGKAYEDTLAPDQASMRPSEVESRLRQGKVIRAARTRRQRADGSVFEISLSANPLIDDDGTFLGAVMVAQDITDTMKVEAAFAEARKMEAIGKLAGGIAHDFNNLLATILLSLDMLKSLVKKDIEATELVDMMNAAATRGATLTAQMLAYGRRQFLQPAALHFDQGCRWHVRSPAAGRRGYHQTEDRDPWWVVGAPCRPWATGVRSAQSGDQCAGCDGAWRNPAYCRSE